MTGMLHSTDVARGGDVAQGVCRDCGWRGVRYPNTGPGARRAHADAWRHHEDAPLIPVVMAPWTDPDDNLPQLPPRCTCFTEGTEYTGRCELHADAQGADA